MKIVISHKPPGLPEPKKVPIVWHRSIKDKHGKDQFYMQYERVFTTVQGNELPSDKSERDTGRGGEELERDGGYTENATTE